MTRVSLTFNPYQEQLTVQINDAPISPYSMLKKLETLPFIGWADRIFDIIDQEINDTYEILYRGQLAEYEILKFYAARHSDCQKMSFQDLSVADSPKKRLGSFERLLRNGSLGALPRKNTVVNLCVCGLVFVYDYPKMSFNRVKENRVSLDELMALDEAQSKVLILAKEQFSEIVFERIKKGTRNMFCLILDTEFKCIWAEQDVFCFSIPRYDVAFAFTHILNVQLFPSILREALRAVDYRALKRELDELYVLDKVEPGVKIIIPRIVEVGKESTISVMSIPAGYPVPNVIYEYSDTSLIRISGNRICALSEGVAYVTAINALTGAKISDPKPVTCIKRKYLERITIDQKNIVMRMGEIFELRLSYFPADADNISDIRYQSSDALVAYAEKGLVYAKHDGNCEITISCDNIHLVCNVEVRASLMSFDVIPSEITMKKGSVAQFKIIQHPSNSVPERYLARAYPEGIVQIDVNSRTIQGVSSGAAFVQVKTEDGKLFRSIRVTIIDEQ